jgi:hypothetical protein
MMSPEPEPVVYVLTVRHSAQRRPADEIDEGEGSENP